MTLSTSFGVCFLYKDTTEEKGAVGQNAEGENDGKKCEKSV